MMKNSDLNAFPQKDSDDPIELSVLIPAHNEEKVIEKTIRNFARILTTQQINHEVLIVNDNSTDNTKNLLIQLSHELLSVRYIDNLTSRGFGQAVKYGLNEYHGRCVAIVMADGSDDPKDLISFYRKWCEGYDCVFGDRFAENSIVVEYPWPKLFINRLGNNLIRALFLIRYKDVSNAFKLYSRHVIDDLHPLESSGFNLTVELPLKAIVKNYTYTVTPNSWYNRNLGKSKWKINETLSEYLLIVWKCWKMKVTRRQ